MRIALILSAIPTLALLGCTHLPASQTIPASAIAAHFVLLGDQGQAVARVITQATQCPNLVLDGQTTPMQVRAPAGTAALRKTVFPPEMTKPSAFPLLTCELPLPAGTKQALLEGKPLPLPATNITRIVVIGDTGCRIAGNAVQNCNDPAQFPFAQVAAAAARWKPQLVLHVGDYHYRETACPVNNAACAGSPWGYGWDAWQADFFQPAQALLQAAPWVVARGNHESCARAGQGWYRWLDTKPLQAGHDCNQASDDDAADFNDPFAVPLGQDAQLLIMDSSKAGNAPLAKTSVAFAKYDADYTRLAQLASQAKYNFAVSHHPLFGLYVGQKEGKEFIGPGSQALLSVFSTRSPRLAAQQVQAWLAGHIHTWQQIGFSSDHPSSFIVGNSGSSLDPAGLPEVLPPGTSPAPGAVVATHATDTQHFGFMTMERDGPGHWQIKLWDTTGKLLKSCELEGRSSYCKK